MKISLTILTMILIFSAMAYGQKASFTAKVTRTTVSVAENFQLVYSLDNIQGSGFRAPNFKGFRVVSGPSQMQSTNFVNGRRTSSISNTYVLQAKKEGTFTIMPASMLVDGKKVKTNSVQISVVALTEAQKIQKKQEKDAKNKINTEANKILKKNIYITLKVSKNKVFKGEQIVAVYKLFINPEINIVESGNPKIPVFANFWTQEIELPETSLRREIVDGVPFRVAILKKVVLLPQKSGKLTIDPLEMNFTCRLAVQGQQRRRRSFFDDPFGRSNYKDFPYKARSRKYTINVKELPDGAPLSFNGAVGNLDMIATMNKKKTKTNEPVTLKIKVSGNGNLKLIDPFDLNLPPDIDNFDPKVIDNLSVTSSGVSGSKTFEYLLIPRNKGTYSINPVTFSYYDLKAGKYNTISSDEFIIDVEQGKGGKMITTKSKKDIQYINEDIRFLKKLSGSPVKPDGGFYLSTMFFILNTLPVLAFLLILIYKKRQDKLNQDIKLVKSRGATKMAQKRLRSAKELIQQKDSSMFYEEISKALWNYVSDRLQIEYSLLTKDSVKMNLNQMGVGQEKTNFLLTTLDQCDQARFAPSIEGPSAQGLDNQDIYNKALQIIAGLEEEIKS